MWLVVELAVTSIVSGREKVHNVRHNSARCHSSNTVSYSLHSYIHVQYVCSREYSTQAYM